ncbi:thioredoxin-related protein [Flavobacterium arsenatis]|uniref:Thioredoxin-related protein n=1 Tax=Flavobacterium arsenatis TaxID=1484332 RepID=A0ABU1TPX6_9FLAO|nr:thioredoxin family protein [Flavobacterium arsenatis]MDR6967923.1 thioredoxin-related protein [Flavobacterium arsenatis]
MKPNFLFQIVFLFIFTTSQAQIQKSPDYETAKVQAKNQNKDILIVLTGSEWCKPCVKMKKNVFENQEFIDYASQSFVIFEVNMPRNWDMNSKVYQDYAFFKEKYQTNALPSLILLDSDEQLKAVVSEKLTSFEKTMETLKKLK